MYLQASGRLPSTSVKPYTFASCPLDRVCPFQRDTSGSRARAATARPTKAGLSEIAKWGWIFVASRHVASVTRYASSIASDRSHPGVTATAVAPRGPSSCPRSEEHTSELQSLRHPVAHLPLRAFPTRRSSDLGVPGEGGHRPADEGRALRDREVGLDLRGVPPRRLRHAVRLEHRLGSQPSRSDGHRCRSAGPELVPAIGRAHV